MPIGVFAFLIAILNDREEVERPMNLQKMITELEAERDRLSEAILVLERLSLTHTKRRGRPPHWLKASRAAGRAGSDVPVNDGPGETDKEPVP